MAEPLPEDEAPEKKKRGKKILLIPALVLLLGMGGGGYFFFMGGKAKPKEDPSATTTTTIHLGKIVRLDSLTLNLSDGHVLKVGLALQLVEKPKDKELLAAVAGGEGHVADAASPLSGQEAKALDEAIRTLGDSTFTELSKPGAKLHAKEKLSEKIKEIYEGDVTEVYFTDFVMS